MNVLRCGLWLQGKHVLLSAPNARGKLAGKWNGRGDPEAALGLLADVQRKMTPAIFSVGADSGESDDDEEDAAPVGYFDLVVRVFRKTETYLFR